ncbi:MAG: RagB/SusD family nutrient uptake outer membrane protein [Muribaculaceae bacterium]|nr:RagB/SusD family nutrient uptake outer membrane protein [Muribaculaceae bacterium]
MKLIYSILAAGTLAFGAALSSCSDFLTEDASGQLAPEAFFKTDADLEMALNAMYFNIQRAWCNSNPTIPACQGDDMTSTTGSNKSAYLSADAYEEPSDYKGINFLWQWQYNIIQAANQIIDNADKAETSQDIINIAKGNAYFWRAVAYFQLVRTFGPLPMNLHNAADNNSSPLTPESDVYAQIVQDLTDAEACNLPATYAGSKFGKNGHMGDCDLWITQQAVKSLQAAVYMNMAGYPLNLGSEYYKKAADAAKVVIDGAKSGKYAIALEPEWKNVYSYGSNYSSEMIVAVSYISTYTMNNNSSQFSLCHRHQQFNSGWGDFLPERYYWSKYPEGPRKDAVYDPLLNTYKRDEVSGDYICVSWWATSDEKPYVEGGKNNLVSVYHPMFSAFNVNATDNGGTPVAAPYDYRLAALTNMAVDQTHRVIRYAEVLCWFAEASARAGVYQAEALAALKEVQARAYNPGYTPDNSDLAEAAYREHGYEVAGYPLALVTRRSDEFRMDRLKDAWEYRHGPQNAVLVPKGTITHSFKEQKITDPVTHRPKYVQTAYTYVLDYDVIMAEDMSVAPTWGGINSIYQVYPPQETEKNPNIKR